jgi:hypothetical protein
MLQTFRMDVVYAATVVHVCCKRMFLIFYLFFQMHVALCLCGCYICFTYILQNFYLDVANVLQWFSSVFKVSLRGF